MAAVATAVPHKGAATIPAEDVVDSKLYTFTGSVSFGSEEEAILVCKALEVDPELHPEQVSRELQVQDCSLIIKFAATELRLLRAAVSTFYDLLALAIKTAERFGPARGRQAGAAAAVADPATETSEAQLQHT